MNFEELFEKYQSVLDENNKLKEELKILRGQLCYKEKENISVIQDISVEVLEEKTCEEVVGSESADIQLTQNINNKSDTSLKIKLFMDLFKGRTDVYAKRWENDKKGTAGYSPKCLNEWKPIICAKPQGTCAGCKSKNYDVLSRKVIDDHLRGNMVVGLFPMCLNETCHFLAIDFDDGDWEQDITALRQVCGDFNIPIAVERSRSGTGGHTWFFFKNEVTAVVARKFGTALITHTMNKRHDITFKSYDRFFPNQDTMPKGGLGNLIALPLQKAARNRNNSLFVDEAFNPFLDQWEFLSTIRKLADNDIEQLTLKLWVGNELGVLKKDDEETIKPWENNKVKIEKIDFPKAIKIVKEKMIYIPKEGVSQRALNSLKRLAAFKNPEFYKAQAMRMPTGKKVRIICCADETEEYLCLPRGCEGELKAVFEEYGVEANYIDKTNCGKPIDVEFKGILREDQPLALEKLIKYDNGVLSGTTAFGKTVVAINLIAKRKVSTLIIVDKVSLVSQWEKRLKEFLIINETLSDVSIVYEKKRGRKKVKSIIGQLGAGKDSLNGIVDIAVMQSLNRMGEVKECVANYGMVIVDECHHVSAFSFEEILKNANAKYVYGLTATPTRKDGHHPIIFMQCGPIRYRDDARKQAEKRPFEHYIIPRFTSLRLPLDKEESDISIQELYSEIVINEVRNQLIIDDVVKSHENGRNCLVLTERTAHVEMLAKYIGERIPDVIALTGGMGRVETREVLRRIEEIPISKQLTLVATGKYIGEGFDEPRLDTLFLAMPISWKGTLQQYAGRLHRLFEGKSEVQVYDYVDIHVRMLEKMYSRRLSGYAAIGYKAKGESISNESINSIFDKSNFLPIYTNDIVNSVREVLIVSPFITKKRVLSMLQYLEIALDNKVRVIVVTRPIEQFSNKDMITLQLALDILKNAGVSLVFKVNIHQKFAVVDEKVVWYGSINLLSFGTAEESIMRLESSNIANELIRSIIKI